MKVAWFDTEEWEKEYLSGKNPNLEIEFFKESLNENNVEKAAGFDAVAVFVPSEINASVLEDLDADLVCCRSTGFDHVDLEKASEEDIDVCNVPAYGGTTVAEHAFGLILSLSRKIPEAVEKVEEGEFDHSGLRGFDLKGKTLGVVGTGTIGQNVIRIANGFDMDVIASDPYPKDGLEEELGFMYVSTEDLLKKADVVTLHCPLTDDNHHLLSREEFELMDGSLLVNTARGGLVDTEALIEALEKDNIQVAGLDVLEEECYVEDDIEVMGDLEEECDPKLILEDHILMNRDDVIITPHNAFNSIEAMQRIADTTIENVENRENTVN
ncbi:MAG: hydroxyacid dehydrogenase [Nanohaloarchaea archaeon]|nr:hydroxyacid dehydrogenase [Candidatus Nanohaloarchaea archaeon]